MPERETAETTIDGHVFRFMVLGGKTVRRAGGLLGEALIRKSGLASAIEEVTQILVDATTVAVQDKEAGATAPVWVKLSAVYEDRFGGSKSRLKAQGEWLAWTASESGLTDFLDGLLSQVAPDLLTQLKSIFQQSTQSGGSTA
jgi:hypothetical protein